MTQAIREKLFDFYDHEVPAYVVDASKTSITISANGILRGLDNPKITIVDVAKYYATQAHNITSGIRTIAGITGDWRQIDNLASECLEWFKFVNVAAMRSAGRAMGIEPKF